MTISEAAAAISVGRSTMYRLVAEGKVPCIRITNRLIRIRETDLARALETIGRDALASIPEERDATGRAVPRDE